MRSLETFSVPHQLGSLATTFIETMAVVDGVTCDVYTHQETEERDLGLITIEPGKSTPPQKVIAGEETIEIYLSGKGKLVIIHADDARSEFVVDPTAEGFAHLVAVGEKMQWQADDDSTLVVAEVCFPPYEDGRFQNLDELH